MDLHLARALLSAWQLPQFRDALQHLIDLDEVTGLLAALAAGAPGEQTQKRLLELLRTASETEPIREAVLLLVADDAFRDEISAAIADTMPERPGLAHAVADPDVARYTIRILGSDRMRASLWKAVDSQGPVPCSHPNAIWKVTKVMDGEHNDDVIGSCGPDGDALIYLPEADRSYCLDYIN